MKLVIVSDIHINSYFSKKEKFLKLVRTLDTDILIINGDLYDLYLGLPTEDIINTIKENKSIKEVIYIRGNHDFWIKDYLTYLDVRDSFEIADILITHGHQYDFLSEAEPKETGLGKTMVVLRHWVEKTFKFNVRLVFKKITFCLVDTLLFKAQKKAAQMHPNKKVILGHTHIPVCKYPHYNTGCMVDGRFTYMVVNIDDGGNSSISLVQG